MSTTTAALSPHALREAVHQAYSTVAASPATEHAFPVGRAFAEDLGYPAALLDSLPPEAVAAFAGVSHVSLSADISEGQTVLDLGCGSGLDTLIAARRTGPSGRVIAVDFSEEMLCRTRTATQSDGAEQVQILQASAEDLPLPEGSVDVALINGILNLNPLRAEILAETARVLRPGGTLRLAELVLVAQVSKKQPGSLEDWFS